MLDSILLLLALLAGAPDEEVGLVTVPAPAPPRISDERPPDLLVTSRFTDEVLRYDGVSGAFIGIAAAGGNLDGPTSFTFGPDGMPYVGSVLTNKVKRYDPASGAYPGNFATEKLSGPHDVAFGPDGRFYVTNANAIRIRVFDPSTGAFVENYVRDSALAGALGMAWDGRGRFYVVNQSRDEVRRYDAVTGQLLNIFVAPGSGGLSAPLFLAFLPGTKGARLQGPAPGLAGRVNTLQAAGLDPGQRVFFLVGTTPGTVVIPGCTGWMLGIADPRPLALRVADESGRATFSAPVPLDLAGTQLLVQIFSPRTCRTGRVATIGF